MKVRVCDTGRALESQIDDCWWNFKDYIYVYANSTLSLVTDIGELVNLPISVIRFSDINNSNDFSDIGKSAD